MSFDFSVGDCRCCGQLIASGETSCQSCKRCKTLKCDNLTISCFDHCLKCENKKKCEKCKRQKKIEENCPICCINSKCNNKHKNVPILTCLNCKLEISFDENCEDEYFSHSCLEFNQLCVFCCN
jgi:hypothetical protein